MRGANKRRKRLDYKRLGRGLNGERVIGTGGGQGLTRT